MTKNFKILAVLFFMALPLVLTACGDDAKKPVKMAPLKKPSAVTVKSKVAPKPVVVKAKAVAQAPTGTKRNPFKSFIVEIAPEDTRVKGPLECCEVGLFRLLAVVSGIDEARGLVQAPDGKKYIVKTGDIIGTRMGVIKMIERDRLIVEEHLRNTKGNVVSKEKVELRLPTVGGAKKK